MKLCGILSWFFPEWTWFIPLDCFENKHSLLRVLLPPVFDLGCEDTMWEFATAMAAEWLARSALSLVTS